MRIYGTFLKEKYDTTWPWVKVCPEDATLLFGTRDSVPMEHCSTLSQGIYCKCFQQCRIVPNCVLTLTVPAIRHCWQHLQHTGTALNNAPWGHCPLSQRAKLHRLDRPLVYSNAYENRKNISRIQEALGTGTG